MLDDLIRERRKKLSNIREEGKNPYPSKSGRDVDISEILAEFSKLEKRKSKVILAGRVMSLRDQGNIIFIDISDGTGSMQAVLSKKESQHFGFWKKNIDIGDIVEFRGGLFKTKRSEYIKKLRELLWEEGFIEGETPILQPIPGGALARPFETKHNALSQNFYLRIAPELYLKRLLVAGYNKIFEIGRVFRNEGMDREHNPEFTMLELYWAYKNYKDMIELTKKILKPAIPRKWTEVSYLKVVAKYTKKTEAQLRKLSGSALDELFKKRVRPKLTKPTIVYGLPKTLSPLSKSYEDDEAITERFQFIIDGTEIANGFSELNDPIDQRERMDKQEKLYRQGNKEASRLDEDFLEALEYGMPPAAGLGVGIDRVAAIYAGKKSVKDVIIFPTLRNKK